MDPGILPEDEKLTVYRGTANSCVLNFVETVNGVDSAIDITGKGPFTAEIRDANTQHLLLTMVAETNDDDGSLAVSELRLSWDAASTANLPAQPAVWGLRDNDDFLWIDDTCVLKVPPAVKPSP